MNSPSKAPGFGALLAEDNRTTGPGLRPQFGLQGWPVSAVFGLGASVDEPFAVGAGVVNIMGVPHGSFSLYFGYNEALDSLNFSIAYPSWQTAASLPRWSTSPVLIDIETLGILISDKSAITDYLHHHPDTAQLLLALSRAARQQLPIRAQLSLDLFRSKEHGDTYLTLVVRQDPYPPDLLSRLDAITVPFDTALTQISGWILLTTDYRAPR